MAYITVTEYNLFAWTSGQDALITELIASAEAALNSSLRITTLDQGDYGELLDNKSIGPYYLNELNSTTVSEVNWSALTVAYLLEWRRLEFKQGFPDFDDWWRIKVKYTAGYARTPTDTLPQDIKTIMYYMVTWLLNKRKWVWITEWSQGQLSVKYWSQEEMSVFKSMFDTIKSKYKKNDIYS